MPHQSNLELLEPSVLASSVEHTVFGTQENIRYFDSIGSTNTAAMQAAVQGAPEGTLFIAEEQLAGRGRGSHSWHSEAGTGIYLSAILRPQLEPQAVLSLSLAAGVAVSEAVDYICKVLPDLRWPNDLLLGGKKVAGILTESSADMQRMHHVVIGIGINVNQSAFPPQLAHEATSLCIETGRTWSRMDLLAILLKSLDRQYGMLQLDPLQGTARIIRDFESRSTFVRGAMVSVHDREAEQAQYSGRTLGLDGRGFLKVQTDSGVRTVLSGGIRKMTSDNKS